MNLPDIIKFVIDLLAVLLLALGIKGLSKVRSARDNSIALIKKEQTLEDQASMPGLGSTDYEKKYGARGYQLYVLTPCDTSNTLFPWLDGSKMGYHSFALAYDIGSLKHLEQYGVNI